MQGNRNDDFRPVGGQCVRMGDRQQATEFFREWFAGFLLEPNHDIAQLPVIRPEPNHGVEVQAGAPTLRATAS
jgi:hypothetical protein